MKTNMNCETKLYVLGIDTGSVETGVCLIERRTCKPLFFGKISNNELFSFFANIKEHLNNCEIAYEQFKNYGMPMGDSTINSIQWNGRIIQHLIENYVEEKYVYPVMRVEEKMHICNSMKAKDSNIRQALIDRFGEVGTKKNPGFFYGFKKDVWSAFAVAITHISKQEQREV